MLEKGEHPCIKTTVCGGGGVRVRICIYTLDHL